MQVVKNDFGCALSRRIQTITHWHTNDYEPSPFNKTSAHERVHLD